MSANFTVVAHEGAPWSAYKMYRLENSPTVYDLATGLSYHDVSAATNAKGAVDVEVRRPVTASTGGGTTSTPGANAGGIMDSKVTLPLIGEVPVVGVAIAAAAAYFVFVE